MSTLIEMAHEGGPRFAVAWLRTDRPYMEGGFPVAVFEVGDRFADRDCAHRAALQFMQDLHQRKNHQVISILEFDGVAWKALA